MYTALTLSPMFSDRLIIYNPLSFLTGLVPIRTINRPPIELIVHIIVQHIAGLYIINVYSCRLAVAVGKREEEAGSREEGGGSSRQQGRGLLGLPIRTINR